MSTACDLAHLEISLVVQIDGTRSTGLLVSSAGDHLWIRGTFWLSTGDEIQLRLRTGDDRPVSRLDATVLSADLQGDGREMVFEVQISGADAPAVQSWLEEQAEAPAPEAAPVESAPEAPASAGAIEPPPISVEELTGGAGGEVVFSLGSRRRRRSPSDEEPAEAVLVAEDEAADAPSEGVLVAEEDDAPAEAALVAEEDAPAEAALVAEEDVAPDAPSEVAAPALASGELAPPGVEPASLIEDEVATDEGAPPRVRVDGARCDVRWRTAGDFLITWRREISKKRLLLDTSQLGKRVRLRLMTPDDQVIAVQGRVIEPGVIALTIPVPLRSKFARLVKWCEANEPR